MYLFLQTAGAYLLLKSNQFGQLQNNSSGSTAWERPHCVVEEELAPIGDKNYGILVRSVVDT